MMGVNTVNRALAAVATLLAFWASATPFALMSDAAEPATATDRNERAARLAAMHERAALFQITGSGGDNRQRFELFGDPIFRYSDQPRGFVDATLWAWRDAERRGRPVAVAKVQMALNGNVPYWQYCVASLADKPLNVDFANERKLTVARLGAPGNLDLFSNKARRVSCSRAS